ncbi:abcG22 [Symbiodinium pilosum]|uniref:AbcG22 protein n=1 Tax=Symbiodinium pilosum TaxID=2952 RepID=A0A812MZH2_SYMPI|nr:abcG22 [Symbiodinium pilosum]
MQHAAALSAGSAHHETLYCNEEEDGHSDDPWSSCSESVAKDGVFSGALRAITFNVWLIGAAFPAAYQAVAMKYRGQARSLVSQQMKCTAVRGEAVIAPMVQRESKHESKLRILTKAYAIAHPVLPIFFLNWQLAIFLIMSSAGDLEAVDVQAETADAGEAHGTGDSSALGLLSAGLAARETSGAKATVGSQHSDHIFRRWKSKMRMSAEALDCLDKDVGCDLVRSQSSERLLDVCLTFKDVAFDVNARGQTKNILAPVSGHYESGNLVAIMGPSGCGKSTLLDILAGKKSSKYSGTIHLNGRPRDYLFPRVTAYVPQEEAMPKYLTVMEAMEFNGSLKFERPSRMTRKMRREWLERRLCVLGLDRVKDQYIGDGTSLRGISGGQKRRLSLAKRLASGARVFFCDEPTSGLSATDAEACVRYMKHICRYYNILVLVVIHQPRIEVANLFDELLLMTSNPGRAVYNGRMEDVIGYLSSVGFEVPMHANPLDFFMDLVTPERPEAQADTFVQHYSAKLEQQVAARVETGLKADLADVYGLLSELHSSLQKWGKLTPLRKSVYARRFRRQLATVFKRQFILRARDARGFLSDLLGGVAKAIVVGVVYMRTGELGAAEQTAFFFMLCMTCAIDGLKNMPAVISERTIVKMEAAEVLYSEWAYIISFGILNTLQMLLVHSIFITILFSMSGLRWQMYSDVYLWSTLLAATMNALYLMVAAIAKDATTAIVLSSPFMMLFLLFNGFTATRNSVVPWMRWAIDISPVAYSIQQMVYAAKHAYADDESVVKGYEGVIQMSEYEDQPQTAIAVVAICFAIFKSVQLTSFRLLNNIKR